MVKKAYSVETKLACIEMKKVDKSNKVIMDALGVKNASQVKTWWRWYQNDELYRFHQPVGNQYTYGKGMKQLSEVEQLRLQVDLLKKVSELGKRIDKVSFIKLVEEYKKTGRMRVFLLSHYWGAVSLLLYIMAELLNEYIEKGIVRFLFIV
ncbi:hypothetical protein GPW75_02825 [Streptococcus thermophilus]|nr:hypothetical protein [Streptococcus thermophilus]